MTANKTNLIKRINWVKGHIHISSCTV